jgi:hypothetical protein
MVEPELSVSFARFHALPSGVRVRLRLAHSRDSEAIRALLRAGREERPDLDVARLARANPRRRVVVCATALLDGAETVVGVGAIDVEADRPDLLCVRSSLLGGLPELLTGALRDRVAVIAERRAA